MIICTKSADTLTKRVFNANEVGVSDISNIIKLLPVDPTVSQPKKEAYIVTSDDVKMPRVRQQFINAVAGKHPNAIIIYISKAPKSPITMENCPGLDKILTKPKPAEVKSTVAEFVSISADKKFVHSSADDIPDVGESYKPDLNQFDTEEHEEVVEQAPIEEIPVPEAPVERVEEEQPKEEKESELARRIREAGSVRDVSVLSRELTASALIKEMLDSNNSYAALEDKLKAIQNKIYAIMTSQDIPKLEDKLDRVRGVLHDKSYYRAKSDTLLEQRVEEIIDTLLNTTKNLVEARLEEIDRSIVDNRINNKVDKDFSRLGGITEGRANLVLELTVLSAEIVDIAKATDSFVVDAAGYMSQQALDFTGSELYNARLRLMEEHIVSESTVLAIQSSLEAIADDIPNEYKQLQLKVQVYLNKLNKLFELDKETIAVQREYIRFLKANHIEDTVTANTLIKKSLRVFVGYEGTGTTIVPYLMSYYKSRQNADVLLVDLTGYNKAADYGLKAMELEDYMNNRNEEEFCYVVGEVQDTVSSAQRILNALVKAADYYRIVNIVLSPDQRSLLDVLLPDVLCVNYLVDTSNATITRVGELIKETKKPNTAQRVVINKCNIPCKSIIHRLGLDDVMDIGLCKIPYCDALTDASINGYNPAQMSSVALAMDEVLRNART